MATHCNHGSGELEVDDDAVTEDAEAFVREPLLGQDTGVLVTSRLYFDVIKRPELQDGGTRLLRVE